MPKTEPVQAVKADVVDRWVRQLGQVDLTRYRGELAGLTNPVHVQIVYGDAAVDPRVIRALTAADIITIANQILMDADGHGQIDVLDYPIKKGDWLSAVPNPPNLDVALSTRASEATLTTRASESKLEAVRALLDALDNALASVATDKLRVSVVDALPAGLNKIGSVDVADVVKVVTPAYLPPTSLAAGGTATIAAAPGAGKKLRVKRLQVSVDAATRVDLRWDASPFESYFLPANGSVVVNKVGENFEGPENAALTLLSSAAATVTASASVEVVAA